MYSKEELLRGLKTESIGRKLFIFDTIDSTNSCAKTLAEAGVEEGAVVISDFQTNGRGRLGRPWLSEPSANLLFSVVLRPPLSKESSSFLAFYAAVSVARAVEPFASLHVQSKWPNDLLLGGKKFCGILLETSFQIEALAFSVIGIGINVNQRQFDEAFSERTTSLSVEAEKDLDRKQLLHRTLEEMEALYPAVRRGDFRKVMKEWNARCSMFGKPVTLSQPDKTVSGTAVGLSPDGGLIIETDHGPSTFYAGDVTVLS